VVGEIIIYQLSRAIYRELAPYIVPEQPHQGGSREQVLRACEGAMARLVLDGRHFAKPARSLFNEIRGHFSIAAQLRVYLVVKHNVEVALRLLARVPEQELEGNGRPRTCQAMTRKGNPCQRPPLPRSDYCPSHQHLTETFEELGDLEQLDELEPLADMELAA
jgi:hypothetical protein